MLGLRISNQIKSQDDDENERVERVAQEKENEKLRIAEQKKRDYDKYSEEILDNMKAKVRVCVCDYSKLQRTLMLPTYPPVYVTGIFFYSYNLHLLFSLYLSFYKIQ